MPKSLSDLICAVHKELSDEIDELCSSNALTKVSTSDYIEKQLPPAQRRVLSLSVSESEVSLIEELGEHCDYGKLKDLKGIFDNYHLLKEIRKQRDLLRRPGVDFKTGITVAGGRVVRSAPPDSSSAAKLRTMTMGLHDPSTSQKPLLANKAKSTGIPEIEFLRRCAPILCPSYPAGVSSWYSAIDSEGTGAVTWAKFVRYLQSTCEELRTSLHREEQLAKHVRYSDIPLGHLQSSPPYRVLRVQQSQVSFYVLCSDGNVREVSKVTLKVSDVVHYHDVCDPHPTDIKFCSERSQLFVALPTGIVFVYDTTGHLNRQGNILKIFRTGQRHPYDERGWSHTGGVATMSKTTKFDPLHMMLPEKGVRIREMPTALEAMCDVFPLALSGCSCGRAMGGLCICKFKSIPPGQLCVVEPAFSGTKDPYFFAGFDSGHISLYKPPMVCPVVRAPRKTAMISKPFDARPTCLKYCDTFSDLRGLLASSSEGHLSLLDVETSDVVMTFRDGRDGYDDGGGWLHGCRPVDRFDVSKQMAVVASCGSMRGISLWSASMRRKLVTFHDHRGPVQSLCFNQDLFQIVSIGTDRTLRVWDIRNMKPLQVLVDRGERVDGQMYSELSYDTTYHRLVAWTGAPYVYQLVDDNIASRNATNLSPVTNLHIAEDEDARYRRLIVAAGTTVSVWMLATGSLEVLVETGSPVGSITIESSKKSIYVVLGESTIAKYVVGSQTIASRRSLCGESGISVIHALAFMRKPSRRSASSNGESHNEELFDSYVVVGGNNGTIALIADRGADALPFQTLVLEQHEHIVAPVGDITALLVTRRGNGLVAATSNGYLVLLGLEREGLVVKKIDRYRSVLSVMTEHVDNMPRQRVSSAPLTSSAASLWRRAVSATRKEFTLRAQEFTKFRYSAQEQMQSCVDCISELNTASSEEGQLPPVRLAAGLANGDLRIMQACAVSTHNDTSSWECVACFPASTADGCGFKLATSEEFPDRVWVADESGAVCEFALEATNEEKTSFEPLSRGPKYFLNVPVKLMYVWQFACGTSWVTMSSGLMCVGLENGRTSTIEVSTRAVVWGAEVVGRPSPAELVLKHRFQYALPQPSESRKNPSPASLPKFARAVAKVVALHSAVHGSSLSSPQPLPPSMTEESGSRDTFLSIVLKNAPAHLREGALRDSCDDDATSALSRKVDSLRFSRGEGNEDLHRTCFHKLRLNDVSQLLSRK